MLKRFIIISAVVYQTLLCYEGIAQGQLWGINFSLNAQYSGIVTRTHVGGAGVSDLYPFSYTQAGQLGYGNLLRSSRGIIYGTTFTSRNGYGTIFYYDPATGYQSYVTPPESIRFRPSTQLAEVNGKLYGATFYLFAPGQTIWSIFEYDPGTGDVVRTTDFDASFGNFYSHDGLVLHPDGNLYGTTPTGGLNDQGTLFMYNPSDRVLTKLIDFDASTTGGVPLGHLALAPDGTFYIVTTQGGASNAGTIVSFDTRSRVVTKLFDFDGVFYRSPRGSLLAASNGKLYGITSAGGSSGFGMTYEFTPGSNTMRELGRGTSWQSNQSFAEADGVLYGFFAPSMLVRYSLTTGTWDTIYSLSASDGMYVRSTSLVVTNNNTTLLYGTSYLGGESNNGTFFQYSVTDNAFRKIANFYNSDLGDIPVNQLVELDSLTLLGVTKRGGESDAGVVFELNASSGLIKKKADFAKFNLRSPVSGMIKAADGMLYGYAQRLDTNEGCLYRYDPRTAQLTQRVLFTAASGLNFPIGTLVAGNDGHLYGMTAFGGGPLSEYPCLFDYDPITGLLTKRFEFPGITTSRYGHDGGLMQGADGKLYGLLSIAGTNDDGILFVFDTDHTNYTVLLNLNDISTTLDNSILRASGIITNMSITFTEINGRLYGASFSGGDFDSGTLFEYDLANNTASVRIHFNSARGINPSGNLTKAPNGKLYGATMLGGVANKGTLFEFNPATGEFAVRQNFTETYGAPFGSRLLFTKAQQQIVMDAVADKVFGDNPFTLQATASSGLPVSLAADTDKVQINGDEVTILKPGRVTITASQAGDSFYYGAAPVSISFCIAPAAPVIQTLQSNHTLSLQVASGHTAYQWYQEGILLSNETSSVLQPTKSGSYAVRVMQDDCVSATSVVVINDCDIAGGTSIMIYPNPADDELLLMRCDQAPLRTIYIYDTRGTVVIVKESETGLTQINVSALAPGLYLLRVNGMEFRFVKR